MNTSHLPWRKRNKSQGAAAAYSVRNYDLYFLISRGNIPSVLFIPFIFRHDVLILYFGRKILADLVSPKIHKPRNDNELLRQYVSMPALGYAKLAWMKGIEVNVESKLIPKELLPINHNTTYFNSYDF